MCQDDATRVLLSKRPFLVAPHGATRFGVKSVPVIGAGALMGLMGAGILRLPATFLTRLGIDRVRFLTQLVRKLESDRVQLLGIVR